MDIGAQELNERIEKCSKSTFSFFSENGKKIYFPKEGLLNQADEAKNTLINATLGVAKYDDGTPMTLKVVEKYFNIEGKRALTYAPSQGVPKLRERWKELMLRKNPSLTDCISLPMPTVGMTEGLNIAANLFADDSGLIISPDLYWESYRTIYENSYNSKMTLFKMFDEGGKFNLIGLRNKLRGHTCSKILGNFPNNPTGYSPTVEEIEDITKILTEEAMTQPILVVLDDAYFGFTYRDDVYKESLFSKLHNASENLLCVKIDGSSKEDYAYGLRLGFITFGIKGGSSELYAALEEKASGIIRGAVSSASHFSQSVILDASNSPEYWEQKKANHKILQERYDELQTVLSEKNVQRHFKALPCNSGYFICLEVDSGIDLENVRTGLIRERSTGIITLDDKSKELHHIRLAFSSVAKKNIRPLLENIDYMCHKLST